MSQKEEATPSKSKKSQFLAPLRYYNTLPEVPFDPKFLKYPFDKHRFVKYAITSLEQNYKYQLHTEPDLGIEIDLINPSAYKTPSKVDPLDEEDLVLLNPPAEKERGMPQENGHKKRRIESLRPSVSWLQRTTYISSYSEMPKRSPLIERKAKKTETSSDIKRREAIAAIEGTFEAPIVHPKNPQMKAVEVLPVFPDFELWPNLYTQVVFDQDPSLRTKEELTDEEQTYLKNNAVLKAYNYQTYDKFLAYMVPKKRSADEMEDEEEYSWTREYKYEVRKGRDFEDAYVFAFNDQSVTYNAINTRTVLSRLKTKQNSADRPSKILVKKRPLTEEELLQRKETRDEIERAPGAGADAFDVQADD